MTQVVLSHPTGNANSRAVLSAFCSASLLSQFHTTVATLQNNRWDRLARVPACGEFRRRCFDEDARGRTRQRSVREMGRMIASKAGFDFLIRHETGIFSIDAVYQDLDRAVAQSLINSRCRAVYCYEDAAHASFMMAQSRGIKRFYDLPIGYWRAARALLQDERERWPQWAGTLTGFSDSERKLERKDRELELAEHVFVASEFTRRTLREFSEIEASIDVIPYGFPPAAAPRHYEEIHNRPLKLLFVGGLSQRKGIADVFAAADHFGADVCLTVLGKRSVQDCEALNQALMKHRWIESLPHERVLSLMRSHDVLLFPSLFEGFGLVISEAMSQGTPVIATDRTAGPDLIEHGRNGWIISAGSTDALIQTLDQIITRRDCVAEVGEQARRTAMSRQWHHYGTELSGRVIELMATGNSSNEAPALG